MALYIIGLGLFDEKDISLKGLEIAKKCDFIYLEDYTSRLIGSSPQKIAYLLDKKITVLDRKDVEQLKPFLKDAKEKDVALLVGGDPCVATTHSEIIQEAHKKGIKTHVIHASSILSALCESGLFAYNFGRSCSIPFWEKNFQPTSFYDIIAQNLSLGAHTAVFLDLRPEKNKFMTINEALKTLLQASKERDNKITEDTIAIGFAHIGALDQVIKAGKISELLNFNFGAPMHILVIPGKLHFMETEMLGLLV